MTREEFLQVKLFMFSDIEREVQLARAENKSLEELGIRPGGGNFLAALGLLCYTEFGGLLLTGARKAILKVLPSVKFNTFFDFLGPEYKNLRTKQGVDVYDIFRCGLAHEYYVKRSCAIAILERVPDPGIRLASTGGYEFVVESYLRDLRNAFEDLEKRLYDSNDSESP